MRFPVSNRGLQRGPVLAPWYKLVRLAVLLGAVVGGPRLVAQTNDTASPSSSTVPKYSDDVVAKADQFLEDAGLRRTGKSIQSTSTSDLARSLTALSREKRELRLLAQDWKLAADQIALARRGLQQLNRRYGELSLQLAQVPAGNVTANNRIVGLLNATRAQTDLLDADLKRLKEYSEQKRSVLNQAEAEYAEKVLAIRKAYDGLRTQLTTSLLDKNVTTAMRVMHVNFQTPQGLTADKILSFLDNRIRRIEQEIFSESIELDRVNGSLFVDVVVGTKSTRMVVDSGAELISLPIRTAEELGIEVPSDAREMRLILADGREIPARAVTLANVRIGEFEVDNVEAAVLDSTATDAQPLLGMSFLGNFRFEIDPSEKSLKMLRVRSEP